MSPACSEPVRLNAGPDAAETGGGTSGQPRECLECGAGFASTVATAEFCRSACRMAFNNRRRDRGAELYDLFMSLRCDRALATALKVWRLLNRLAARFREEDRQERAGRKSWRHPAGVIARHPYLKAEILTPGSRAAR